MAHGITPGVKYAVTHKNSVNFTKKDKALNQQTEVNFRHGTARTGILWQANWMTEELEKTKERALERYFVRDPERNLIYCPGGEILRQKSINVTKGRMNDSDDKSNK